MTRETVLVTGASSGIGLELARCFAADGAQLVLVARRAEVLQDLAAELRARHAVPVEVMACDLARPEEPAALFARLQQANLAIDVLVNNAGFGGFGAFVGQALERQVQMLQLNVVALTALARLLLPAMIERGRGGILNVGSTAAFQPGPHAAVYCATKAYVLSFSEALYEELRGSGVRVTCLAPGATRTEFAAVAAAQSSLLFHLTPMSAATVARAGYRAFRAGRVLVVPGLSNWLSSFSVRFTPRSLVRKIAARLLQPAARGV